MKNLILIFVLLITSSLFAQEKVSQSNVNIKGQTHEWMSKIAVDSQMRVKMLDMMLEETKGNEEEMMKLVNSMYSNPEMHKMILAKNSERSEEDKLSLEPRGMEKDDGVKVNTMKFTKPVTKKK
jgi:hypothetical protein